jgi:curved DNA-binding protein
LPTSDGGWVTARVVIDAPPDLRVWGDDIWMTARLPPHVLRYGGPVVMETPHGEKQLRLAGGVQDGASLRLHGLGLPATATARAGDLIVRLQSDLNAAAATPDRLSAFRERWAS